MRVLYIGGTGTISAACVEESVRQGDTVYVLNRGQDPSGRTLPNSVHGLVADVTQPETVQRAVGDLDFDCVIDFLSFDRGSAATAVDLWRDNVGQYIHISSASIYRKPLRHLPIVESTPRLNPYLSYARAKIDAENTLRDAYEREDFPVTIVRPSHTYDDARPPLPGDWTTWDRITRGAEVVVTGDGTNLWTITHAADLAVGLTGLVGHPGAIGEDFHITSAETYPWDQIYRTIAAHYGVEARLLHLPADLVPVVAPEWLWSELLVGDLSHSAVFDNSKIRRFVPAFNPVITWPTGVRRLAAWRAQHPDRTTADPEVDGILGRLVLARHTVERALADLTP